MVGSDGARLGAVVHPGAVAERIATRTAPLAVPAARPTPPAPPAAAAGVVSADVCWQHVDAADCGVPRLAVVAFALARAARSAGPVHLGLLDGGALRVVAGADSLRLRAVAAALDAAPAGTGATVSLTTGGPGLTSVPPPHGAGWAVLAVGTPLMRPRACESTGGDWGVGVGLLSTLTVTSRAGADGRAAALLARLVDELEHREWRDER